MTKIEALAQPRANISLEALTRDIETRSKPAPPPVPAGVQFPLHTLPPRAQEYIQGAQITRGTPADYVAAAMLWTAATATGNACSLEVKTGELHNANTYLVLIGNPNAAKTPAIRLALRPIQKADAKAFEAYRAEKSQYDAINDMDKKERQSARVTGKPDKPVLSKLLISDATQEATAAAHFHRVRGIGVHRDELLAWVRSFDRYNSGGDLEFWLSAWSAEPISIDRKTSDPLYIKKPFIGVMGGVQPGRLERLAADDNALSGFMDRLLFVWPDNLTKPVWSMQGIDLSLENAYHSAIEKLLSLPFDAEAPTVIHLTDPARQCLFDWFNKVNKPLCDAADNELLAAMHGKFDFHCIRLVLALHLVNFAYSDAQVPGDIDTSAVKAGIEIAEFFREQSLKVHRRVFAGSAVDKLPSNMAALYDVLPELFGTGEGVKIATRHNITERTFKNWLKNKNLFTREAHGKYSKVL